MVSDIADQAKDSLKNGVSCMRWVCEIESVCAEHWKNLKISMNWGIITGPDNPFVCTFFKNVKKKKQLEKQNQNHFGHLG